MKMLVQLCLAVFFARNCVAVVFVDEDPEQRMQDPAAVDADADKVQKARILERHARSTTERARRPSPGTRDRRENQTHNGH